MEKGLPGGRELVALLDGELVGNASLERRTGRRAHIGRIGMGVHDGWVGRGIGTALMAALVDLADNWLGLLRLELDVNVDTEPALALYRRFGFEIEATHRGHVLRSGSPSTATQWRGSTDCYRRRSRRSSRPGRSRRQRPGSLP